MSFLDQAPTRADAKDAAAAKPQTGSSFADEVGKALGDPPVKPTPKAKTAGSDGTPKPPTSVGKAKDPVVPKLDPLRSKLGNSTLRPSSVDYFSIPEGGNTRPEILIPQLGKPSDGKPVGKAPDATSKPAVAPEPKAIAPKAPEPKSPSPAGGGDAKPLTPRPGLPSSGDLRLPSLSRDRMLGKPDAPKPIFFPKEPAPPPSTTVIVPKRDTPKLPGTADTPKPPSVVDTTKPPSVVEATKPPAVDKPPVPVNPYRPLPKVDYEAQKGNGVDATKTTPDGAPPKYPGPAIDQDKWLMKKLLKPSRLGGALYDLYLSTATDRSEENKVPDGIKIAELHKGIKEKVASIELLGDSEMFQPDRHGIVLHPTGRKHPGNFYAVLRDDKGIPINVIEYAKTGGNGKPKYLQQWIFDREADPDSGGRKTTISYFRESSSTAMGRPGIENKTMADVFMGRTEYLAGAGGGMLKATQFNNLNKPTIEIDYSARTPTMQIRDSNSGRMTNAAYSKAFTANMAFSGVYLK